jgi:CIC family chloride channel protein
MMRRLWNFVATALLRRGTAVFLALAVAVGVFVGLAAAALIGALEGVAELVSWAGESLEIPDAIFFATIPLGFLTAWWIARRFAPEVAGDGVPEAAAALAVRSGHLPTRSAPLKVVVTALTVGSGGSAGREGPIVQVGSSIGSSIARHTGLGEDRVRSLVAAGAGAAIGASFNAPIAGMLFAMEVILGNFAIRHLNAVVVASVSAAVTTRSIVGEDLILRAFPHRVRDPWELALYAVLGVLASLVGWLFLKAIHAVDTVPRRGPAWLAPVVIGLLVAGVGLMEPRILGTGQDYVRGLLNLVSTDSLVWYVVLGIGGAKILATALTLGSGGSGGAFMPSLFIGAALGAGFADLIGPMWSVSSLEPGSFAVVGMAATFAAVARAPLTSILIVFEITQDYGLVLPLMLAASLATFLGDRVHRDSVYSMALRKMGIRLTRRSEVDLLDTVTVAEIVERVPVTADAGSTTAEIQQILDANRLHGVPIVAGDRLVGVITVTDITRTGGPSDTVLASEAMTPSPVTVSPSTPVSQVLERMASVGIGRVPVVAEDDPTRLVAMFRREDAVKAYHIALGQEIDHDLGRSRLRARVAAGADFHEVAIPSGSFADGRLLKELPIPGGATVVSIRRGLQVLVPHGNTRLYHGDALTFFAEPGVGAQLRERLHAGDTAEVDAVAPEDDARFFDLEIPQGSVAAGRPIRVVAVPAGCTVVSVRRAGEVIIPTGDTVLEAGDILTVFARSGPRRVFAERLKVGSE